MGNMKPGGGEGHFHLGPGPNFCHVLIGKASPSSITSSLGATALPVHAAQTILFVLTEAHKAAKSNQDYVQVFLSPLIS